MKKLPSKYRMDVVDGKLVFSAPSSKVQNPASVAPVETAPSASAKTAVANGCKQCNKPFEQTRPYPPQLYCTATCRKKYQNKKKYEENRPKSAKRDGVSLSATCAQCNELFLYDRKRFGRHKKFCKKECRSTYHKNIYNAKKVRSTKTRPPSPQPVFVKPSSTVKRSFVERVKAAIDTLPSEEKLPPIPEDTSAASLLAAGRTLTASGLVEAVQNTYGIDVAEERPRPKAFWFSVLLARHSKTLEDWKKLLGKHGLVSNPKIEKWLLFRAGSSSPAAAGRLKAQLGI